MTVFQNITSLLETKCVGIAGAGGLGSNAAAALVRSGIGHLVIADFDTVTPENINRQFYFADQQGRPKVHALQENLLRINPKIKLQPYKERVTPGNAKDFFNTCHVVVEAFDKATEKEWFANWMTQHLPHIPLIMASGIAGWGQQDVLRIQRAGNLYVCGHQKETDTTNTPMLAPRVTQVAMMQADLVLEILLKELPRIP